MNVELGIIEGFYGRPWTTDERVDTISFLAPHGYRFYLYAPKADPFLRRRWREEHPEKLVGELTRLAASCEQNGVRFGVGLTPFELRQLDDEARDALSRKLELFTRLGVRDLGILFDDMRGDLPDLAETQSRIVGWISERFTGDRVIVCPSYYTDDPVLDRVFGQRPDGYLESLGKLLDPSINIFWTGEEVCSREISPAHLDRVAEQLRRRPFLWDNYPVNDGQRMTRFLHLRAFTGRPAEIAERIAAHGINPALQPTLSRIPALSLVESYQLADRYAYGAAFKRAAHETLGAGLATLVREDLLWLQDVGLERLGDKLEFLRDRYRGIDHPAAREILDWLDGGYAITDEIVRTQ
ncbi:MAG: beta-N-acetylglucosaminidase domain-containing protein [Gemmatimonadota bacterium]|jgi:hypothetical protein|nr:beta-N-acetylglucosaminidase domain-containing protein [Gemmatimonadota bacterium]